MAGGSALGVGVLDQGEHGAVEERDAGERAAAGDAAAACVFKRAARLSLASVARWQNAPSGEVQIVKNHFPAAQRYGY